MHDGEVVGVAYAGVEHSQLSRRRAAHAVHMSIPRRSCAAVALAVAACVVLSGCTANVGSDVERGPWMTGESGPGSGMWSDPEGFSRADIMFAQMMIPHHQQAVDMSELAIEKTADPEIRVLATDIRDAQVPEIELMTGWLAEAGTPGRMGPGVGMGMGMGGMLSEEEMTTLENAIGAEFDRIYLQGMIEHHEGAIQMTHMILNSANPEVKALGEAIVRSQTAEIERMRDMLSE